MGETRIELKHLLEDLRDTYPHPQEEVIIVELAANALDSGATRLEFTADVENRTLVLVDDGRGMTPGELTSYHDIAATAKQRGRGIGFAGVGAKIALLAAEHVLTETRRGAFHRATKWTLETPRRAPWSFQDPAGLVPPPGGTAVTIRPRDARSPLLKRVFIERVISDHYPALLIPEMGEILKFIYPKGVVVLVNGRPVSPPAATLVARAALHVRASGARAPAGFGFLGRSIEPLPEELSGIAVSAYGKTIKRGWDWLGLSPRSPQFLTGLVEIPQLVELLTTNKADFLRDAASLAKYYRLRKAVQGAVEAALKEFGELALPPEPAQKPAVPLGRAFERVLDNLLPDFPELSPLLGRRAAVTASAKDVFEEMQALVVASENRGTEPAEGKSPEPIAGLAPEPAGESPALPSGPDDLAGPKRVRRPTLKIAIADRPTRPELGWMEEDTIHVNRAHPAFPADRDTAARDYHLALTIAWVLSGYLDPAKSPRDFIAAFLSRWAPSRRG